MTPAEKRAAARKRAAAKAKRRAAAAALFKAHPERFSKAILRSRAPDVLDIIDEDPANQTRRIDAIKRSRRG